MVKIFLLQKERVTMTNKIQRGWRRNLSILCFLLCCFFITGCGGNDKASGGGSGPELTILSKLWSRPTEQIYIEKEILDPFAKKNNVRVKMDCNNDFNQNFRKIKIQKISNNLLIDVIISHTGDMSSWIEADDMECLDPLISKWKNRTIFEDFNKNSFKDGKAYFVPIAADVYLLMANKKALPYLPKGKKIDNLTWEDFAQWAVNIKKGTGFGRAVVTGVQDKNFIYQFGSCALSYGAGFPDINSKGAVEAWKIFEKMHDAFIPSVRNIDDCSLPMKRQEAWLTVMINARVSDVYTSNPTRYVVAPMPKGPKGRGMIAAANGVGILRGAKQQKLAQEFVEYITRPEILVKIAKGPGGFVPPMNEAISHLGGDAQDMVIRKAIKELEEDSVISGVPGGKYQSWGAVKEVFDNIFTEYVLKGKKITQEVLDKAAEKIKKLEK